MTLFNPARIALVFSGTGNIPMIVRPGGPSRSGVNSWDGFYIEGDVGFEEVAFRFKDYGPLVFEEWWVLRQSASGIRLIVNELIYNLNC